MELRELSHKNEEKLIMKNNEVKRLEEKLMTVEKENHRNSRYRSELPKIEELLREIQKLEGNELTLKLQISDYEERLAMLAQENERLSFMVNGKNEEKGSIDKLRKEIEAKEKKIRDLSR